MILPVSVTAGWWHWVWCKDKVSSWCLVTLHHMHIILYKHTSHYIHYQLSQNTHSQSQTVSTMTALKNSLILITLCLGLAAAQKHEEGEARLLFSNYTSGNFNKYKKKLYWKVNLKSLIWRPPEVDNSKLNNLWLDLPDSWWGCACHSFWLPHLRLPNLPEPVPVTLQIIQWWWEEMILMHG